MQKLKRLIGPAPSEMSGEELLRKIKTRQELVASCLAEFRARMNGARGRGAPSPKKTAESVSLKELMGQMKEAGLTMEDLRRVARGGKK